MDRSWEYRFRESLKCFPLCLSPSLPDWYHFLYRVVLHAFAPLLPRTCLHSSSVNVATAAPCLWRSHMCLALDSQVRRTARIQRKYVKTMQFHPIIVRFSYVNSAASDVSGPSRAGLRTLFSHAVMHASPPGARAARREGGVEPVRSSCR